MPSDVEVITPIPTPIHTIVQGKGKYLFGDRKKESQPFKKGETYLIPAKIGDYDVHSQGNTEIVVSYVE